MSGRLSICWAAMTLSSNHWIMQVVLRAVGPRHFTESESCNRICLSNPNPFKSLSELLKGVSKGKKDIFKNTGVIHSYVLQHISAYSLHFCILVNYLLILGSMLVSVSSNILGNVDWGCKHVESGGTKDSINGFVYLGPSPGIHPPFLYSVCACVCCSNLRILFVCPVLQPQLQ